MLYEPERKKPKTFVVGDHATFFIVNILFKAKIFPVIGEKYNQSSVSDADQEISTLGSMGKVGNSRVGISRSASKTDNIYPPTSVCILAFFYWKKKNERYFLRVY